MWPSTCLLLLCAAALALTAPAPAARTDDDSEDDDSSGGDLCPKDDSLKHLPCRCHTYPGSTSCQVTCTHATLEDLRSLSDVYDLCDGNVHLDVIHSVLDGIPAKLWRVLLSSEEVAVRIINSSMTALVPAQDSAVGEVSTSGEALVEFEDSKVKSFDWKQLKDFRSERDFYLSIDGTPLESLGSDFSTVANGRIHSLGIDHCGLKEIGKKEFASFLKLKAISLMNNQISEIHRSMFAKPAKKLKYIHLNGNLLTTIPGDFFTDMPALKIVYLKHNHLKTLPEDIFHSLPGALRRIDFRNNPWNCDCDLITVFRASYMQPDMGYCATPSNVAYMEVKELTDMKC